MDTTVPYNRDPTTNPPRAPKGNESEKNGPRANPLLTNLVLYVTRIIEKREKISKCKFLLFEITLKIGIGK